MYKLLSAIIMALIVSGTAVASDRDWHPGHGYGHHKHHRKHHHHHHHYGHHHYRPVERVYYREEVHYVPQPPVRNYRNYGGYQPAPHYRRYDNRSVEGAVGGAFGSVIGYEVSRGDPLGAGIGAAFGSLIGNEIRR